MLELVKRELDELRRDLVREALSEDCSYVAGPTCPGERIRNCKLLKQQKSHPIHHRVALGKT
jgi:hypothetical protein